MLNNLTPVVRNLLIVNVILFILKRQGFNDDWLMLHYFEAPDFHIYQLVSYLFIHADLGHIFGNMFALFMFGPLLERLWGAKRFIIFYFVCGIGAGLLYSVIHYFELSELRRITEVCLQDPTPLNLNSYAAHQGFSDLLGGRPMTVDLVRQYYSQVLSSGVLEGASGAIFGILMAFGMLFPNTELFMFLIPFPIKAKYFVTLYGLYELYAGIQRAHGDNVAHFAHVGGMLFAFILIRYWGSQRNNFY